MFSNRMVLFVVGVAGLAVCLCPSSVRADITFSFSQGDLSASATFSVSGDTLTVTLRNTAAVDVSAPEDVLTGLFFDIDGFGGPLTKVSALLESLAGTPVLFANLTYQPTTGYNGANGDVGSEAGYRTGASSVVASIGDHAIGMVGMEDFLGVMFLGEVTLFDSDFGNNLQGPNAPDGIQYGIVNASYVGGGNAPLNGPNALITTGVIYTFGGFFGFDESDIGNVNFNYGTDFSPIPVPGAGLLAMVGFGMVGWIRRRSS